MFNGLNGDERISSAVEHKFGEPESMPDGRSLEFASSGNYSQELFFSKCPSAISVMHQ